MKIFLLYICFVANLAFGQNLRPHLADPANTKNGKEFSKGPLNPIAVTRAAAGLVPNCDCQCDSYMWSDGQRRHGNCLRYIKVDDKLYLEDYSQIM